MFIWGTKLAESKNYKMVLHAVILIALLFALLFALTWTSVIKCSVIPYWCELYYSIPGVPSKILIVFGNEGMGNPQLLKQVFSDRKHVGIVPETIHVDLLSTENLKEYNLIIVEKARKMKTQQLKMFMDYANAGGKLVWVGDSGTELAVGDELLFEDDVAPGAEHKEINPWARKQYNIQVKFNEFLGVNYNARFCGIKKCSEEKELFVGLLVPEPQRKHPLIYALSTDLRLFVNKKQDFALVSESPNSVTKRVLSLDYLSNLVSGEKDYGNFFPLIITTGLGEKVIYFAIPPEHFVEEQRKDRYYSFIENIYEFAFG